MDFLEKLTLLEQDGTFTKRQGEILRQFYASYTQAYQQIGRVVTPSPPITLTFLDLIVKQIRSPYPFQAYHEAVLQPDNYQKFGLELIRPLIDPTRSVVLGSDNLDTVEEQIRQGHNCIFFANHQTEPDPQAIHLLLEKGHSELVSQMVFVAGDRVIADPIAVPFSKGRNMLCIYSRKHMNYPPERKAEKHLHNRRALQELQRKLRQGGISVYIAPSGGRDRPNAAGEVSVSPFERDAIDLFDLLARDSKVPTHFYPLSLATHKLLPPPPIVEDEVGEDRTFHYTPIGLAIGQEIDMSYGTDRTDLDKKGQRQLRAEHIYAQVCKGYDALCSSLK